MSKITRTAIVGAGLELLDAEGLEAVTTRKLAQRLGVESPALYWHFRDKAALLQALASEVVLQHHLCPPPTEVSLWLTWYADNARSFRQALLRYRDGARLHAGTVPGPEEQERVAPKVAYLVRAGMSEHAAGMALYAASQYTLGCVLEEQARPPEQAARAEEAFEFGLRLLVKGLGEVR